MSTANEPQSGPGPEADLDLLTRIFSANQQITHDTAVVDLAKAKVKQAKAYLEAAKGQLTESCKHRDKIDHEIVDYVRVRVPDEEMRKQRLKLEQDTEALKREKKEIEAAKDMDMPPWLPQPGAAASDSADGDDETHDHEDGA